MLPSTTFKIVLDLSPAHRNITIATTWQVLAIYTSFLLFYAQKVKKTSGFELPDVNWFKIRVLILFLTHPKITNLETRCIICVKGHIVLRAIGD